MAAPNQTPSRLSEPLAGEAVRSEPCVGEAAPSHSGAVFRQRATSCARPIQGGSA